MPIHKVIVDGASYDVEVPQGEPVPSPDDVKEWLVSNQGNTNTPTVGGGGISAPSTPPSSSGLSLEGLKSGAGAAWEGLKNIPEALKNPENWPTIGGVGGGLAGAGVVAKVPGMASTAVRSLGIPTALAGLLGAGGSAAQQYNQTGSVDPGTTALEGLKQGGLEFLTGGGGYAARRGGSNLAVSGSGLKRPGFSQNFPTAAEEQMEGGRFSAPIITAQGARRVAERHQPEADALIAREQRSGVQGPLPSQVAVSGLQPVLREIKSGAGKPNTERSAVIQEIEDFIRERPQTRTLAGTPATFLQANTPSNPFHGPTTYTQGQPATPGRMVQGPIPLDQLQLLKKGLQSRAQQAMKGVNNEKFPGVTERTNRGLALGAQTELENRVPGLKETNRRQQGLMGLNQALNPSFRSPTELQEMGVEPAISHTMTTQPDSYMAQRMLMDSVAAALGATGGGYAGGAGGAALGGLGAGMAMHAVASPTGRRMAGSGAYVAGRVAPNSVRAARLGGLGGDTSVEMPSIPENPNPQDADKDEMMRQIVLRTVLNGRQP